MLHEFFQRAQRLSREVNFGDCEEGRAVGQAFRLKAQGGANSACDIVRQAQQVLGNMAETYQAAGSAYAQTEEANQQLFRGGEV